MVVVKIGSGIGAGVIADGYLHRGARGSAGDVGHIQVTDDRSVVCRCGNLGCLEASPVAALARDGEAAADDGPCSLPSLDQKRRGHREDVARAASARPDRRRPPSAGHRVGATLAGVVNFFNPSLIVIGGGVANARTSFSQRCAKRSTVVRCRSRRAISARPQSSLGGLAGVIGASSMVVDQLFARDSIGR